MTIERFVLQVLGWAIGIPLEILVILALFRGGYRRYPVVFLYVLVNFATTLVDIPINTQAFFNPDHAVMRLAARTYWVNEWILQVLIFATVLSLIDLAISQSRWRRTLRVWLAVGAVVFAAATFWIQYQPPPATFGSWMTPWTADLSVCATVLDLGLWMILIASRGADRRLLLICGALGMQFTAEAMGEAIVNLSKPHLDAVALGGAVVAVAGNLICLYVWWQTFRPVRAAVPTK